MWSEKRRLTEREDFREWPLSSLTAKDAVRAKQPNSLQTPSHFRVWFVLQIGNYALNNIQKHL